MEKSMKKNVPVPCSLRQILSLALLLLGSTMVAQNLTVKGLVVDSSAEPVIGANVLVEGTTNGTITDFEGLFTLQNVPSKANLVISFIGYKTQVVPVSGQKDFKIVLKDDSELIDEVVVIGYGTTSTRKTYRSMTWSALCKDVPAASSSSSPEENRDRFRPFQSVEVELPFM